MELQEIYDTVVTHLVAQGRQAMDNDRRCLYRAPNGDKCAAGCLIPDDVYDESMEQTAIEDVIPYYDGLDHLLDDSTLSLLSELQTVHDTYAPEYWPAELTGVAINHGLNCDALRLALSASTHTVWAPFKS